MATMELYIHFGIYKAGSSYLQYVLANSREFLLHAGIYFPSSKENRKMVEGRISKGNADGLGTALMSLDSVKCTNILKKWEREGKRKDCTKILISAEAVVHQLAKPQAIKILEGSAKNAGFPKIYAMGFFRDLADHALSTYKHRAKSGKIPNFEDWLSNTYETPMLLQNLYSVRINGQNSIEWKFRKFQKNSQHLLEAFFVDWLDIDLPSFQGKSEVNQSVTLSEVLVMNEMTKCFPLVTDYFVDQFKALPSHKKGKDVQLTNYFNTIAMDELKRHENVLNDINIFFAPDEKLIIGKMPKKVASSKTVVLAPDQLIVLSECIHHFQKSRGRLMWLRRWAARKLPKEVLNHLSRN